MKTLISIVVSTALLCNFLNAQNDPEQLTAKIKAISTGDKIIIRWAPTDFTAFTWGNEFGYTLQRATLLQADTMLDPNSRFESIVILDSLLKPLPDTIWEPMADTSDMAGIAAAAIYGEEMVVQDLDSVDYMTAVNMNKQEENRFGFGLLAADASLEISVNMGLAYIDTTIVPGTEYIYMLQFNNIPSSVDSLIFSSIIRTTDTLQLPIVQELSAQPGDSSVLLSWRNNSVDEIFSSYVIERSDDGGNTWQVVNSRPMIFTSNEVEEPAFTYFSDSLPSNGNPYIFRIRGKSPFGIVSEPSDTVVAIGKPNPIDTAPRLDDIVEEDTGKLTIKWSFPVEMENKIQGFEVYRAVDRDSIFSKISTSMISSSEREFEDATPKPVNYYEVRAIDVNDYEISSLAILGQLVDNDPPLAPKHVFGDCDKTGQVKIYWSKSESSDVMGYRVYISNQEEGEYTQITNTWMRDTFYFYQTTLNTLSEEVYFAVKAVDFHENFSVLSDPCAVTRPDIVPPAPPLISNVFTSNSGITFEWKLSESDDLALYKFQRKPKNSTGWITLTQFDPYDNTLLGFFDSTASYREYYEYRLLVYDNADNFSSSKIITAKAIDNGIRDSIMNFTGQLISLNKTVKLEWEYPDHPDLIGFQIFRGFDTTTMRSFKYLTTAEASDGNSYTLSGHVVVWECMYIDGDMDFSNIPNRTTYTIPGPGAATSIASVNPNLPIPPRGDYLYYQVIARYIDGSMSPLSNFVVITLP